MKVGIISLFSINNVNFGNRLQAYALNRYLRDSMPDAEVVTLYFTDWGKSLVTVKPSLRLTFWNKAKKIPDKLMGGGRMTSRVMARIEKHNEFSKSHMLIPNHPWTWEELTKSDFDVLLVGSDVIWGQNSGRINRRAFLDFETSKPFKRISYAASFGKDWIPTENVKDVKRCLERFQSISVREKSSIELLNSIGVDGAKYVCDPTLLISERAWRKLEKKPIAVDGNYVFAYLLGRSQRAREIVQRIARELNYLIVTVPYATGEYNRLDKAFGDVKIMDCGIEEWLWLIDHASLVVTDSFHGTVFASVFKKKFLVVERTYSENINNRMVDFLQTIEEEDKMIKPDSSLLLQNLAWNHDTISGRIAELKKVSNTYLIDSLRGGDLRYSFHYVCILSLIVSNIHSRLNIPCCCLVDYSDLYGQSAGVAA